MNNKQQLFIPDRINVGFQNREDTYTKKLAYVIYFDNKGVLRKETSWQNWRDKKIKPIEFKNEPTEGFVLNKGVGGQRHSYGWNARNEYIRVFDPRGFEFEISVANLLFILRECDCSKGKGLEGKFVYAWDGTELVLLPEISEDYQNSKKYTELQGKKVKAKDVLPGYIYLTKKQEKLVYLGKFDFYTHIYLSHGQPYRYQKGPNTGISKKFVFWNSEENNFDFRNNLNNIAEQVSDSQVENFAELVENYFCIPHGSKIKRLFLKEAGKAKNDWDDYWYVENDGVFSQYYNRHKDQLTHCAEYSLQEGILVVNKKYEYIDKTYYTGKKNKEWVEPTKLRLFVELESGKTLRYKDEDFGDR